jgi:hypothetical protein
LKHRRQKGAFMKKDNAAYVIGSNDDYSFDAMLTTTDDMMMCDDLMIVPEEDEEEEGRWDDDDLQTGQIYTCNIHVVSDSLCPDMLTFMSSEITDDSPVASTDNNKNDVIQFQSTTNLLVLQCFRLPTDLDQAGLTVNNHYCNKTCYRLHK